MGPFNSVPLVFVLDDDPSVCRSLARLIRSVGFEARTFASAAEFLQRDWSRPPSCLVVDVRMPGQSGLDLQDALCADGWTAPIVMISGHGSVPMSVRAMRRGAVTFLQKPFEDQAMLDAIREAVERGRWAGVQRRRREEVEALLHSLTPRELEVFTLVVAGLPNKKIAGRLGASEKTVKVHRGRVMVKMRAESLAELVHLAHEAGLGQTPHDADFLPPAGAGLPGRLGQRADLPLVGASEVFADSSPEHSLRRRGGDEWERSRVRRSSPSSGSS
jgi:FixJ family two-component response regulator